MKHEIKLNQSRQGARQGAVWRSSHSLTEWVYIMVLGFPGTSRESVSFSQIIFFFFLELACHITVLYYFNKTFSLVSFFHSSFNGNDHFDTSTKGEDQFDTIEMLKTILTQRS